MSDASQLLQPEFGIRTRSRRSRPTARPTNSSRTGAVRDRGLQGDHRRGREAAPPGMLASVTRAPPCVGVPVQLATLDGLDSLLSIVQMPAGIPVATVSINGAKNAGLLAARILGASDARLGDRVEQYAKLPEDGSKRRTVA
ncbi:MAG: AIR carboxylase family protein [Microbacterium sp.]